MFVASKAAPASDEPSLTKARRVGTAPKRVDVDFPSLDGAVDRRQRTPPNGYAVIAAATTRAQYTAAAILGSRYSRNAKPKISHAIPAAREIAIAGQ